MTGGGGENPGRLQPCSCCHLEVGKGKRFERKRGGWCEDESRTECRPGRKEKRKKKKESGNPFKI